MIKSFDLAMEQEAVEVLMNDPQLRIISCTVDCLKKTGYTSATFQFEKMKNPMKRKRARKLERFILFNGSNSNLDTVLSDFRKRIVAKYEFVTEQGVIIVLDYEYLKEGL